MSYPQLLGFSLQFSHEKNFHPQSHFTILYLRHGAGKELDSPARWEYQTSLVWHRGQPALDMG